MERLNCKEERREKREERREKREETREREGPGPTIPRGGHVNN